MTQGSSLRASTPSIATQKQIQVMILFYFFTILVHFIFFECCKVAKLAVMLGGINKTCCA
jgi:hypothetical protein